MEYTFIAILMLYNLWVAVLIIYWLKIPGKRSNNMSGKPLHVAVLVPFRNECNNLKALVDSLRKLRFAPNRLSVYLIDDHSDDGYVMPELPAHFHHKKLPAHLSSKKAAIAYGVDHADADIMVTTDADCLVRPCWIDHVAGHFSDKTTQMVFGGVVFRKVDGLFARLQSIEFASLTGTGAAAAQAGQPIMCNGANLAFRRTAFLEVGGFEGNLHIASGDDEFLLAKIKKKYPKGIKYLKSEEAVVSTAPATSFSDFMHQRKRWAGKWAANINMFKLLTMALVLASSLVMLLSPIFLAYRLSVAVIALILVKIGLDGLFIGLTLSSMGRRMDLFSYLLTQVIHPFYVLFFAIVAHMGGYVWKGRRG